MMRGLKLLSQLHTPLAETHSRLNHLSVEIAERWPAQPSPISARSLEAIGGGGSCNPTLLL
jgi:hypothetical protein